jgi:hypothetical protein
MKAVAEIVPKRDTELAAGLLQACGKRCRKKGRAVRRHEDVI